MLSVLGRAQAESSSSARVKSATAQVQRRNDFVEIKFGADARGPTFSSRKASDTSVGEFSNVYQNRKNVLTGEAEKCLQVPWVAPFPLINRVIQHFDDRQEGPVAVNH